MKISGKITYQKAVILDKDRMNELEDILLKYAERIKYTAVNYNNTEIEFTSLDELLIYENFKNRRIKELNIMGLNKYDIIFMIKISKDISSISILGYYTVARINYYLDSMENETLFKEKMLNFLKKTTAKFWLLGKFSLYGFVTVPCVLITFLNMFISRPTFSSTTPTIYLFLTLCVIISIIFLYIISFIDKHFFKNLFPSATFLWGEEIANQSKWYKLRNNLFWGVIMAIIIGVITTYICSVFLKI